MKVTATVGEALALGVRRVVSVVQQLVNNNEMWACRGQDGAEHGMNGRVWR